MIGKTTAKLLLALGALSLPAMAQGQAQAQAQTRPAEGRWQVKAFLSGVLPDGKIIARSGPAVAMLNGADAKASDNWVPTLAVEYFVTDTISIETICCATGHHMTGTGTLAGVPLVEKAVVMPFMVSAKYHFDLGGLRPYIGAGPALIVFAGKQPSQAVKNLGLVKVDIPGKVGAVVQAGIDIPLNAKGLLFSADAKRFFDHPVAHFKDAAGVEQIVTRHKLDPWVVSAGLGFRF